MNQLNPHRAVSLMNKPSQRPLAPVSTRIEDRLPNETEKVSARAYALWESAGRPEGCDVDHWLRAQAEIKQDRKFQKVEIIADTKREAS